MKVQDQTLVSCASVSWVVAGSNMGSTTCLSSSNSMAVRRTSALTNGSSVAFSINLASSHTCTSTDYVYVSLYETNGNRQIEYATV